MDLRMLSVLRLLAVAVVVLLSVGPAAAAAVTVTDSRGAHTFAQPPQRVVALSWSLVEQVVELGVAPVGVADPAGYREWVVRPALPEAAVDVGLRQEPNVERIAALDPDVILVSDDQAPFVEQLERIAPVLHFETFSADHDNLEASRRTYLELATLLGREEVAHQRLAERDARLAALRAKVQAAFDGAPPAVAVVRFVDEARVRVYGGNAMSTFALEALGVEPALDLPASKWGLTQMSLRELAALDDGVLLYIEPFPQAEALFANPLWRAMPFVQAGRVAALPSTWTYGGLFSTVYLAEAIADALLRLDAR